MFEFQKRKMEKEKEAEELSDKPNKIEIWFINLRRDYDNEDSYFNIDYDEKVFEELKKKVGSDAIIVFNDTIISCKNIVFAQAIYDEDWE